MRRSSRAASAPSQAGDAERVVLLQRAARAQASAAAGSPRRPATARAGRARSRPGWRWSRCRREGSTARGEASEGPVRAASGPVGRGQRPVSTVGAGSGFIGWGGHRPNPSQAAVPGCAECVSSATTSCAVGAPAARWRTIASRSSSANRPGGRGDTERGIHLRASGQGGELDRRGHLGPHPHRPRGGRLDQPRLGSRPEREERGLRGAGGLGVGGRGAGTYGDGVPVVVMGVTPHQGERESRLQGQVAQVFTIVRNRRGMCNAESRNPTGDHP